MVLIKDIILGSIAIIIGVILLLIKHYFFGLLVVMSGMFMLMGITNDNKSIWYIGGFYFLIGGILSFFIPTLLYPPLHTQIFMKMASISLGIFNILFGIYMILKGIGQSLGP